MLPSDADYNPKVILETVGREILDEPPFHLLLLGNWSGGKRHSANSDLPKVQPVEIDRDNFDEVLKKFKVGIDLEFQNSDGNNLSLSFTELEDFHPDRIFERLTLFSDLRDIRRRLKNSDTFNNAAREVRSWFAEGDMTISNTEQSALVANSESVPNDLLDQILTQNNVESSVSQSQNAQTSELNAFIKNIVKPHIVQIDIAEQSELLMIVDEVISDVMRKVLHHPQFQALESAWRGVHLLVRRTKTDADLKIYLFDINENELAADLKSVNDLTDSLFYKIIAQDNNRISESKPWAAVLGNYSFSLNVEDIATLIRIAKIASETESPFLSSIKPQMFGFDSFALTNSSDALKVSEGSTEDKLWNTLRSIPETAYLGLALPRVIARMPYGEKTEPTETFYFEEFKDFALHENYLWLNPSFIVALLLAQTFRKYGWRMSQNFLQDIDGLPMHIYKEDNDNKTKPCAEITMTQNNCERILEQGLIPLISYKNTDRVRLGEFRSVAYPASLLKGRWS